MSDIPLRLIAFDRDDLHILSTHAQDAVVCVGDMAFDRKTRTFALLANRFDWNSHISKGTPARRRCAIEIRQALAVKTQGIDPQNPQQTLNLLAITFNEESAPAGSVILHFSGDAAVQIHVECLETTLADLSEAWQTQTCPSHNPSEE